MSVFQEILLVRNTLIIVLVPLAALPILFIDGSKDTMIFSFSCLSFALTIERWNLHRRIALGCLLLTGSSPKWLTLGFMVPTWFLSMWVNNTSATAMMIPVASAVLKQLAELESAQASDKFGEDSNNTHQKELAQMADDSEDDQQGESSSPHLDKKRPDSGVRHSEHDAEAMQDAISISGSSEFRRLCKALSLCVCYSATIGGTASLTGTGTNLVMQGQADEVFATYHLDSGVNFLTWIICCLPMSFTCLVIAWIWLVFHFFGLREVLRFSCGDKTATEATRSIVRKELHKLGPITFAEKVIIGHFILMLTLWLTMKMPGGFGWGQIFQPGFVSNSTTGVIVIASLFVFPSNTKNKATGSPEPLMTWQYLQDNYPWQIWMLLGGAFAMASSCQKSGLSAWFGARLTAVASLEPWLMLLLLSLSISFMTEITSNVATVSILAPIMAQLAISLQVNPLYLLYATALTCSMAFMLPVATAPNAIVFATGYIKIKDMVKAGLILNVLCVVTMCIFISTWFTFILGLDVLPPEMLLGEAEVNLTQTNISSSARAPKQSVAATENSTDLFLTNLPI
ncbi:solute carrier family 13 member 5-like [Plakobranchus ocellatus]|uniref:Solute carrier family 13 member 5-like n=1 Tax=Plakobranchus ocellatus TaxID=259542 RepID=A0AAV4CEC1_9GAST|nr:solute carrier family 13 member 5-like [Plakobranchus ocellatus]